MTFGTNKKETIRTIASVIADLLQIVSIGINSYGLWWLIHHSH